MLLPALGGWERVPGISRAPLHRVCQMAKEKCSQPLSDGAGPMQKAAGRRGHLRGGGRLWQVDGCLHTVGDKCALLCQVVWPWGLKRG